MFDFGFSELCMIGAVALVVLGPEKLPVVARTAGQWLGKAQRMVQQVKSDIEREAELSELKKIQEEAKSVADNLTSTVKGQMDAIEKDVKSVQSDVNAAAQEMTEGMEKAKSAFSDLGSTSSGDDLASAFDKKDADTASTEPQAQTEVAETMDDFYDWYGREEPIDNTNDSNHTTFEKRYKCGPSIDELAEQIEKLKAELGDRSPQLGGYNRRLAARARSNRVRIYR
ncbi:MAG: Sec-independent protein translocase protein TatB [Sutterellaceae bacterium]|nr:Sec-independent protein translocase protein TatB [Sutterellaceae bacterium]